MPNQQDNRGGKPQSGQQNKPGVSRPGTDRPDDRRPQGNTPGQGNKPQPDTRRNDDDDQS